jgi:DNA invertase Pin-like site-specific DNA recombinase
MATKPTRFAAIYLYGTDVAEPRAMLEALARARAWQILETHHDTRGTRPELKRLQTAIMAREVDALMVWDLTELGNGVLEVVGTAAWLHAQGVYLYARHPDGMETHDVRGRARLELIAHLAEFQAYVRRQRAKGSGRTTRSTGKR